MKIISTSPTFGKYSKKPIEMLQTQNLNVDLINITDDDREAAMIAALVEADILIVGVEPVTAKVIEASPKLKLIAKHGAGVDNIDLAAASKAGIKVVNAPGANSNAVAEYVLGLMLNISRGINKSAQNLKNNGIWAVHVGDELYNKTFGIIGTGQIGTQVIKRLAGFDANILAYDVRPNKVLEEKYGVKYTDLNELLIESDYITLHVHLDNSTKHLINDEAFKLMKKSAYLINASRGGTICEKALYEALVSNAIAGAAIDVFEIEPAISNRLLELDNFIGTPHIAGYSKEALTRVGVLTSQSIIDFVKEVELKFLVNA